jgi:hypothetical protein
MKSKFYKKVFWGIILIVLFGLISTGCLGTGGGGGGPIILPPTTCTVIVKSESNLVAGQAVYMDGQAQPSTLLLPWGSVQINNVSIGYHVFTIIQGNTFSHNEYLTTVPGVNYVYFYFF